MKNSNNGWDYWYVRFRDFLPKDKLVTIPESDFIVDLEREIKLLEEANVSVPQPYSMLVTLQTLEALYGVKENLGENEQLGILRAYRSAEMLTILWIKRLQHVEGRFPQMSLDDRIEFAGNYTASPFHPGNPPHSRGDAVDVTLYREGEKLITDEPNVIYSYGNYSDMAVNAYEKRNPIIHNNRLHLREVMTNAGFIPYEREYWHFGLTETFPKQG